MKDSTTKNRFEKDTDTWSVLEKILRDGAQRMLIQAIENEIDEFIESCKDGERGELSEDAKEALEEVESYLYDLDQKFEWVKEHIDDEACLLPLKKESYIVKNTMFLTKQDARDHIEANHYHYTKDVHTYVMTAWRSPTVEKLIKILETADFTE